MHQRGAGMNAGQNQKRIGERAVQRQNAARQTAIDRPRRRDVPEGEDRQVVTALELNDHAEQRHDEEQAIEREVARLGG